MVKLGKDFVVSKGKVFGIMFMVEQRNIDDIGMLSEVKENLMEFIDDNKGLSLDVLIKEWVEACEYSLEDYLDDLKYNKILSEEDTLRLVNSIKLDEGLIN